MPVLDEPKYPVIDRAPSLMTAVKYFRLEDYLTWAGLALPAFPIGYYFGNRMSLSITLYITTDQGLVPHWLSNTCTSLAESESLQVFFTSIKAPLVSTSLTLTHILRIHV